MIQLYMPATVVGYYALAMTPNCAALVLSHVQAHPLPNKYSSCAWTRMGMTARLQQEALPSETRQD